MNCSSHRPMVVDTLAVPPSGASTRQDSVSQNDTSAVSADDRVLDELHLTGPVQEEDAAITHRASGSGRNDGPQTDPGAAGADARLPQFKKLAAAAIVVDANTRTRAVKTASRSSDSMNSGSISSGTLTRSAMQSAAISTLKRKNSQERARSSFGAASYPIVLVPRRGQARSARNSLSARHTEQIALYAVAATGSAAGESHPQLKLT